MNEPEIFKYYLNKIIEDWSQNRGANFLKIAKEGIKSYTHIDTPFSLVLKISENGIISQNDFKKIKSSFEKQIEIYSNQKFKREIYIQAIEKINKIKNRLESNKNFNLEDAGCDLLNNFHVAYSGTPFENDSILTEIGDIGSNLEWKNADKEDWRRVTHSLRYLLIIEANKLDPENPVFQEILPNTKYFTNEKILFENILSQIREDWQKTRGKNFGKIAKIKAKTYTYDDYLFLRLEDFSKQGEISKSDFETLEAEFENQIEQYSDPKSKKYIYIRALEKLNKIIERFETDDKFSAEDFDDALFFNFDLAYLETAYKDKPAFWRISRTAFSVKSSKQNWKHTKTTLQKILTEIID